MMQIRFSSILRKYEVPYALVRPGSGGLYDDYGDYIPAVPDMVPLRGVIQPVSAELQQAEGGQYTAEDRTLYTVHRHESGDLILYQDQEYTVDVPENREYSDTNKYIIKKRVANDPVQRNP
ncbi:hypothetical protein E6C60_2581 [Paenibacillus algicola]|uniref:Uncharacterized protein n=1 Tax=Paenibacillus algicola TaxID=2565926 RepID=A0A4P8XLK3_9BACL|nr:hypothetical protein [Paenibacillus algicola]QCT03293.1 hypothetical protein E6C60_2581 [Paenibacillus algicola]